MQTRVGISFFFLFCQKNLHYYRIYRVRSFNKKTVKSISGLNFESTAITRASLRGARTMSRQRVYCYLLQFRVYSGYYYFLMLVFVGAGVYKLTSTGWNQSFHLCCREPISHLQETHSSDEVQHGTEERQKRIQNTDSIDSDSESQPV